MKHLETFENINNSKFKKVTKSEFRYYFNELYNNLLDATTFYVSELKKNVINIYFRSNITINKNNIEKYINFLETIEKYSEKIDIIGHDYNILISDVQSFMEHIKTSLDSNKYNL